MNINPEHLPIVIHALNVGFVQTLKLFAVTLLGAIPLGLIISFGSMNNWRPLGWLFSAVGLAPQGRFGKWLSNIRPIRALTRLVVWVVRGTPLMIQLLIIYYFPGLVLGNPIWGGSEAGRFTASAVAFVFNYACYFSEIYRGGIQGVPRGQQEAGLVLGMTRRQIFFKVTLLQMIKRIVPPIWAGQAFMKGSQGISGVIWPLFFTAIYYLIFNGVLTVLLERLERKLDYFR